MKCRQCGNEAVAGLTQCQAHRDKDKAYRAANKEKLIEYRKQYRIDNKDKIAAYNKEHRAEATQRDRALRMLHPERYADSRRKYRNKHREKFNAHAREYSAGYYEKNKELVQNWAADYRARRRGAFKSPVDKQQIFERDNYTCQLCGMGVLPFVHRLHPLYPTIDHIVPIAAGGTHEPANVQTAHRGCNCSKGAKDSVSKHYVLTGRIP